MRKKPSLSAPPSALRQRAEARLQARGPGPQTDADPQSRQHELEVHQIELELQNEELQQARAELEAALAQSIELYDFAPAAYLTLRPDGFITQANLAAGSLLGVQRAQLLNRDFGVFTATADRLALATLLARSFASQLPETGEFRLALKGKSPLTVLVRASAAADGRDCRLVLTDITARKQAEHRLGERVKELEAFYGLAAITERRGITLDEIYQEFVNLLPASWQYPEVACALLVIGDRDFRTANFKASPWLQSEILRAGGVVVGRLEVRYLEERPAADTGPFLQEEQRLLAALATQIGILTERKQTEAALQRERDRLRQILDSQSAFVAVLTLDGTIEEINQTPLTLVGQTRAEVLGRNFLDLGWFEPDVAAQVRELVVAAGRGEMARADIPGDFPKLGRRLVDGVFTPLRDAAGVITHVIAFGMDITEGKRAQQALETQRQFLSNLIENASLPVFVKDGAGHYQLVNRAFEEVSQRKRQEILGQTDHEVFPGRDGERFRELDLAVMAQGVAETREETITSPAGKTRTFVSTKFPTRDAAGELTGICGMALEITEFIEAETVARQLAAIVESSQDAIIGQDREGIVQSWNQGAERLFGYTAREMVGDSLQKLVLLGGQKEDETLLRNYETLWRAKDGQPIHLSIAISPIKDRVGKVIGYSTVARDTGDRKRAEAALRESEALAQQKATLLRAIMESPKGVIIFSLDRDYRYTEFTRTHQETMKRLWGVEIQPGVNMLDVIKDPAYRARAKGNFDRALRGESVVMLEEYGDKSLYRTYYEDHYNPIREADGSVSGLTAFVIDVTERRQMEEAHARLATAVEQAGESIMVTDTKSVILYVNPAFEKSSGYTRAEVLGQSANILKPVQQEDRLYREMWECLERGETWKGHFMNQRKDGVPFEEDATISPIRDGQGRVVSYVAVKRDVTREKQLEAQFRQTQKLEAVGQLAGGIAHDFNNILAAILGNAQLAITDTAPDHPARESLDEIRKASGRAKDLVQQILTFSRQQPQDRHVIALEPIITETVKFLRATIPASVEIVTLVAADPPSVLADATQIHQVLVNLCTNAWHALEDRPGRVSIRLQPVILDTDAAELLGLRPGRFACLSVSDTGKGMEAAVRERIFDPFFTTKEPGQGTGLGLSVVRGIVDSHDGAITAESEPGRGATFTAYLPATTAAAEPETAAAKVAPSGQGRHVLYLDDENALVRVATRMIERLGYRVTGFTDVAAALQAFCADPGQFDVVMTDLNMPGASGVDFAREILALRPEVPVLLCSGRISEETQAKARKVGIRAVLQKPHSMEELSKSLHDLVA